MPSYITRFIRGFIQISKCNWIHSPAGFKSNSALRALVAGMVGALLVAACDSSDSDDPDNVVQPTFNLNLPQVVDPAPQFNEPGEYGCVGCPDTDLSSDTVTTEQAVQNFAGIVDNADGNGQWYIEAADGRAVGGSIETALNGNFTLETPLFCGAQIVKCEWSNEAGSYVIVTEVVREQCTVSDIQLTLNWDNIGDDFELHLIKPGGKINDTAGGTDCTWTTCISTQPDWGVQGDATDNPIKDVDDVDTFGPENIRLSRPETGTYSVLVEHWGDGSPEADGNVAMNVAGNDTIVSEVTNLAPRHVWYVGDITWPSQEIRLDGRVIDCSENWSAGCLLDLPNDLPVELVQP